MDNLLLKHYLLFTILILGIFSIGFTSFAQAHPHISLEIMDTHSHDLYTNQDFVIHTFEQVILFVGQIQNIIFS